jgi:ABC-type Mn2+/Zn2+ transport system ATPase subunit
VDVLAEQGVLVIVITHDMHFVSKHADRVVVLSQANLLMDGPPREVLTAEETLGQADVEPPAITRIGLRAGLPEPVLSIDELLHAVESAQD